MKEVNQVNGQDIKPAKKSASGANSTPLGRHGGVPGVGESRSRLLGLGLGLESATRASEREEAQGGRAVKRLSSPERWEIKQLIAAGVMDARDVPGFDAGTDNDGFGLDGVGGSGVLAGVEETE